MFSMIMKLYVVCLVLAVATAAPQARNDQDTQLLKLDIDNDGLGSYRYAFEQSDGSKRDEQGELINAGTDDEFISVKGSYTWVGPDGVTYTVTYIADDKGFQPTIEQGTGGGVPPAVVASLLG